MSIGGSTQASGRDYSGFETFFVGPMSFRPMLLILCVCALLLCLWTPFLVITSAPSFHGSSHDLWLMFSFVSPYLLCL